MLVFKRFLELNHIEDDIYRAVIFEMNDRNDGWFVYDIAEVHGLAKMKRYLNKMAKGGSYEMTEWVDQMDTSAEPCTFSVALRRAGKNMITSEK